MILVTGATGTTGGSVVHELNQSGTAFKAMARDVRRAEGMFGDGVMVVRGDLEDTNTLDESMAGVETLFLLTPPHDDTLAHNHNAISAAARAGVRHVVKLSAIGAAVDSPLQLGRWHGQIEQEVVDSGMGYTFLQAGSFMQNFLSHSQTVREQSSVYTSGGDGRVAMIDTRDIGAVAARILVDPTKHAGQTYVLTGREAISDREATAELSRALGREITHVQVSAEDARGGMERMGLPAWLIADLLMLSDLAQAGHMAAVSPHTEELLAEPPRSFADFAADFVGMFGG